MMGTILAFILGAASVAGLLIAKQKWASFSTQNPADYADGPPFDIREKFDGPLECEGIIYGPTGRVSSRFVAQFDAHWNGQNCVMKEVFHYDSGTVQNREWQLTLHDDGAITANANDLVGQGQGRQQGSAVVLNYRIKLTDEAGGHVLDTTDWMYLMANGTIMNRSEFRKFGIKVAELVATIRPVRQEQLAAAE